MTLASLVPVPEIVAQRAWECAADILDHPETLVPFPAVAAFLVVAVACGPERLDWPHCQFLFQAHRKLVERAA